ncbi:MAG: hypothetical protein DHS20C21_05100 [Gemmatimonadota bacterium]|nr:MAG: hypothetical protein DHS20C21_05100 [Gemmatimonadota bacterium]
MLSLLLLARLTALLIEHWGAHVSFDDAFVFCRYADHLLGGHGLAWNAGGPQTYGATSLLYLLWITALQWIVPAWSCSTLLRVGAWIPTVLAMGVIGVACARLARRPGLADPLVGCGFVALCVMFQPGLVFHVTRGMDTTLAILTNAVLVLCVCHPRFTSSAPRVIVAAVAAYITLLARPDNFFYAALIPPLVLALDARPRWRLIAVFAAAFAVLVSLDTLVKFRIFGDPLPLAYYVKSGGFYDGYTATTAWNPILYTRYFLVNQALPLLLIVVGVRRGSWRMVVALLLPCLFAFGVLGTTTQIMGYQARLYYPALPFWIVAAYHVLGELAAREVGSGRTLRLRPWIPRIAAVAVAGLIVFPVGSKAASWYRERVNQSIVNQLPAGAYPRPVVKRLPRRAMIDAVTRLVSECPPGVVWAMSEHGAVSADNPQVEIVDLTGLHNPVTREGGSIIHDMLKQQPDVIWLPPRVYTGIIHTLLTDPEFRESYDFWPGAFNFGLAIRKDSPHRQGIESSVAAVWTDLYGSPPLPSTWPGEQASAGAGAQ